MVNIFKFSDSRYSRQEAMPEWGVDKQSILKTARVAVIGAGGVKSTLLLSLVAGGIGTIKIIEYDRIELSNLNRQLLFRTKDIGKFKGEVAVETLTELNPDIDILLDLKEVNEENINDLLEGYDLIVEGGNSPFGRNLINEYCLRMRKPMVHASAQFSYGYVLSVLPHIQSACFACYFSNDYSRKNTTGAVPVNVLATSIAGSLGAVEVFKWFLGYEENMIYNKKLYFSSLLLSENFDVELNPRNLSCPVCSKYYE